MKIWIPSDALLATKRNGPDHDGGKYESNGAEKILEIGGDEAGWSRCSGESGQIPKKNDRNFPLLTISDTWM